LEGQRYDELGEGKLFVERKASSVREKEVYCANLKERAKKSSLIW
jgi:hypothetical protein